MLTREKIVRSLKPSPTTLILIGLIVYLWFRPPAFVSDETAAVPDFVVQPIEGAPFAFASLKGKVVLVNFWASWCPYCRHEMPPMRDFYNDYRARGFEVVTFSADATPAEAQRYLRENGYPFITAMSAGEPSAVFGGVKRLPTSFIIDKRGAIRHKIVGQVHYARLEKLVVPLLAEK